MLFVCVQNAGRSQMATLLDHYAKGDVHVRSAGSAPGDRINPNAITAMAGSASIFEGVPKPMTDEVVRAADAVVTMGCGDACPIYPGKRYEDWRSTTPPRPTSTGSGIRDDIGERVKVLLAEVVPTSGPVGGTSLGRSPRWSASR